MQTVLLVINLLICISLIGLVLLQRSEGGALGVGGGGGGALMSGRGAADTLARLTAIAGGLFLVCSLFLTVLAGAAQTNFERSVLDVLPRSSAPSTTSTTPPPAPPAAAPAPLVVPAPAAAPSSDLFEGVGPTAPAPTDAATRARPIEPAPLRQATAPAQPARTQPASAPARPAATQPARPAATAPATTTPATTPARRPTQTPTESVQTPTPEPAPRRVAGPDQ